VSSSSHYIGQNRYLDRLVRSNEKLAKDVHQVLLQYEELLLLVLAYRQEHPEDCECHACTAVLRILVNRERK
jgi:hypothetical protein